MIHYVFKQRNQYSCGPVAVLNALKWRRDRVTYDSHYEQIKESCKTDRDGTTFEDLEATLLNEDFVFTKTQLLTDVKEHLRNDGAVIIFHLDSTKQWHYSFWYDYRFKMFHGANIDGKKDERCIEEMSMRRLLLYSNSLETQPIALLLKPEWDY